jgi:RNA-directed DNA polymerase
MKTGLERVKQLAELDKKLRFNNLAHHISRDVLRSKIKTICANSASGIDGMTKQIALQVSDSELDQLLSSVHRKAYKAPPVRRVYIPKPGKAEKRPIGIPTILDRAMQSVVAEVLSAIYETDFVKSSFGGRPNMSCHHALSSLHNIVIQKRINFVLEADLKNFFGSLDHTWMLKFLSHRISDSRVLNIVERWLKAGVMEDSEFTGTDMGVPQGGSISVVLSNIYLHYALDLWLEKVVKPRLEGGMHFVRYLDDFVICFENHRDADKVQKVLPKRLGKFSLELEPSKTALMRFGRYSRARIAKFGGARQRVLTFLGFDVVPINTKEGKFSLQFNTNGNRLNRFLQGMKLSIRKNQHLAIKEQQTAINQKLRGHLNYFGLYGNSERLQKVRYETLCYWRKVLCHRSQNGKVTWDKMNHMLNLMPLAAPKIRLKYVNFVQLSPV